MIANKITMPHSSLSRKRANSEVSTVFSKHSKEIVLHRVQSVSTHPSNTSSILKATSIPPKKSQTGSVRSLSYNKWFIKPSQRLKRSVPSAQINKTHDQFYYRQLFKTEYSDPDCPFRVLPSEKLKLFEQIPKTSVSTLDNFKRNQKMKQRRVPQIIEMLLKHSRKQQTGE